MTLTVRTWVVLLAVAFLFSARAASPTLTFAQETPAAFLERPKAEAKAEVERLLKTIEPRDHAWAAHLCAKHDLKECLPLLAEGFLADENKGDTLAWLANQAIFDALIRLGATPPPERLMPFFDRHSDEVILLLLREPEKNQGVLLSILTDHHLRTRSQRFALCSTLVAQRAPGIAAYLLKQRAYMVVSVLDRRNKGLPGGIPGGYAGVYISRMTPAIPEEFPPITFHSLIGESPGQAAQTAVPACGPPVPVYHEMTVLKPGNYFVDQATRDVWQTDHEYIFRFINALKRSEVNRSRPAFPRYHFVVYCEKPDQLSKLVVGQYRRASKEFTALKRSLVSLGALTQTETESLKLRVTLQVSDLRKHSTRPLPDLPENFLDTQEK
jgi:hypothetical protein